MPFHLGKCLPNIRVSLNYGTDCSLIGYLTLEIEITLVPFFENNGGLHAEFLQQGFFSNNFGLGYSTAQVRPRIFWLRRGRVVNVTTDIQIPVAALNVSQIDEARILRNFEF